MKLENNKLPVHTQILVVSTVSSRDWWIEKWTSWARGARHAELASVARRGWLGHPSAIGHFLWAHFL
jgi:hypothetical protein